jgi:hypothetical protein
MSQCLVIGCREEGRNKLGVRCRVWHDDHPTKQKTDAVWAPDLEAYLCDKHAASGARITLLYEANISHTIAVRAVYQLPGQERRLPINP